MALGLLQGQAEGETHFMQVHAEAVAKASLRMLEGKAYSQRAHFLPGGVTSHFSIFSFSSCFLFLVANHRSWGESPQFITHA